MFLYRILHEAAPVWASAPQATSASLEVFAERDGAALMEALMAGRAPRVEAEVARSAATLLAPSTPTKIVCIGLNYRHHAEEMNKPIPPEPLMFMKPTTALLSPGGAIELPAQSSLVHHEGELAVVIGRRARRVDAAQAREAVLGYTCANDVTARDIQRREKRYTRGKGFDTFCPLGPAVRLASGFEAASQEVICRVNGEQRQRSGVDDLIFDIPTVISFVSHVMTLLPGDVILTGTPMGVGPLEAGDEVEVEVSGVGVLRNRVVAAPSSIV